MKVITERVVGYFPLSIATSLALESLVGIGLDENGQVKNTPNQTKPYEALWINIRTLIRNIVGSVEGKEPGNISPSDIAMTVLEELGFIKQILKEHGPHIKVRAYYCGYRFIEKSFPHAELRIPNTEKQKALDLCYRKAWEYTKNILDQAEVESFIFQGFMDKRFYEKTLIITHIPVDLLSYQNFKELSLLESHTGAIKGRNLWHTKFHNGKELIEIPFISSMLQIFGDNETFRPIKSSLRKLVLATAIKYKWSFLTTRDKARFNIESIPDLQSRKELLEYFK